MARIEFIGTPTTPLVVTPASLPANRNLQFMYAYRADFSDLDLSGYDLRDSDWIDCVCERVNLTDAQTNNLYSRRTSWRDSALPEDMHYSAVGLVDEAMRQRLPMSRGRDRGAVSDLQQRVEQEHGSWVDSIRVALDRWGERATRRMLTLIFQPWPKLVWRLEKAIEEVKRGVPDWESLPTVITREDGATLTLTTPTTALVEDRQEAERILEAQTNAFLGERVRIQVHQLTPWLWIRHRPAGHLEEPDREDWWRGGTHWGPMTTTDWVGEEETEREKAAVIIEDA